MLIHYLEGIRNVLLMLNVIYSRCIVHIFVTHFFAVLLNLLRSSNEQGCARRVCAVFSAARLQSQVVSPS